MIKNIFFSFLLICGIASLKAQSIHQLENDFYSKRLIRKPAQQNLPLLNRQTVASKLNKIVFGFLPDWQYLNGSAKNIRYDLISHLAVFSFQVDASGNLTNPANWPWNDVINYASANGVKLIATITNFSGDDIHSLLTDAVKRNNLFVNIRNKMLSGGFNGVNIDFENVKDSDKPIAIGNFFFELRKYFLTINTAWEISFASPVVNWGYWNFSSIALNCDYLYVMCYDFYGSWSTTTGPSSPFQYINNSFNSITDYAPIVSSSPHKLILGIPYYGNYWKTKTSDAYTTVDTAKTKKGFVQTLRYKEIFPAYQAKEIMWDDLSKTRWLRWQDAVWNQIWYDDDSSLAIKYDYAIQKDLGGIGIWALGYDDGRTELWKLIERKFTVPVGVKDESIIPSSFRLFQNYPNPFNPSTTINYQVSTYGYVTLKVFDLLGREVATLVDEEKQPGIYNSQFLPKASTRENSQLPAGVYFYTLKSGNFSNTKKMLLIK
jgi:spore germination protein YaaH